MSKEIQLKHGPAIIDDQDFERISQFHWNSVRVNKQCEAIYATTKIAKKTVYMHRMVMGAQPGQEVDHIFGNGLDNRRDNLRFVTSAQNKMNQGVRKNSTSRIKGVSWSPERRRWQVYIQVDGKRVPLGRFESVEEAVKVRKDAELKHYGEYAPILDYADAIDGLKSAVLPMKEMVGRGRKKGFFGVRPKTHTAGHVGVSQHPNGKWIARLSTVHLGYFLTFDAAVSARRAAELQYFGTAATSEPHAQTQA